MANHTYVIKEQPFKAHMEGLDLAYLKYTKGSDAEQKEALEFAEKICGKDSILLKAFKAGKGSVFDRFYSQTSSAVGNTSKAVDPAALNRVVTSAVTTAMTTAVNTATSRLATLRMTNGNTQEISADDIMAFLVVGDSSK